MLLGHVQHYSSLLIRRHEEQTIPEEMGRELIQDDRPLLDWR